MKTTAFHGRNMSVALCDESGSVQRVRVPTLSAYAVEYAEFVPPVHVDAGQALLSSGTHFSIEADELDLPHGVSFSFGGIESCRLVIHYHGIRDYSRLFPTISDDRLRERLGQLYEEAERTFESGSWLAFALMAAAIYEGLLGWKLDSSSRTFADLIKTARQRDLIGDRESGILNAAREHRNLVHAARFESPWVKRAEALDMRLTMDGLIRRLAKD